MRPRVSEEHKKAKEVERCARYRERNRALVRERARLWARANKAKLSSYRKLYVKRNKQILFEKYRAYYAANKEVFIANLAKRRAALFMATPKWSDLDRIKAIYKVAQEMSAKTGIRHHVDHIVPLNNSAVCGLHVPANLRVVIAYENRKKGNRHWPDMP